LKRVGLDGSEKILCDHQQKRPRRACAASPFSA
jgi:hypothetical protein